MLEIAILNKLQNMQAAGSTGSLTTEILRESGTFRAKKTGLHYVSLTGSGAGGHPKFGGSSAASILRFPVWLAAGDEVPVTVPAGGKGAVYPGCIASQKVVVIGGTATRAIFIDNGGRRLRAAENGAVTTIGSHFGSTVNPLGDVPRWPNGGKVYGTNLSWVDPIAGASGSMSLTGNTFGTLLPIGSDSAGNIYAGVQGGCKVVKVTPAGACSLLFGSGTNATTDGTGAAAAITLNNIYAHQWTVGPDGSVYWLEMDKVRKSTPSGTVSTLAGGGSAGADGIGTAAGFSNAKAIVFASDGFIYVLDNNGGRIRKVSTAGAVTTLVMTLSPTVSEGETFFAAGTSLWMDSGLNGGAASGCRQVALSDGAVTTWSSDSTIRLAGANLGVPFFSGRAASTEYAIWTVPTPGAAKVLVGGTPGFNASGMVDGGPGSVAGNPGAPASFGGWISAPGGSATNGTAAPVAVNNALGAATVSADPTLGVVHIPGVAGVGAASGTALAGLPVPPSAGQFVGGQGLFGPGGAKGLTPAGWGGGGGGGNTNVFTTEALPPVVTNGDGAPGLCAVEY